MLLLRTLGAAHLADAYEEHAKLRKPILPDQPSSTEDEEEEDDTEAETETEAESTSTGKQRAVPPPDMSLPGGATARPSQSPAKRRHKQEMSFSEMVAAAGFARVTGSRLLVSLTPKEAARRGRTVEAAQAAQLQDGEEAMQLVWTGEQLCI